MFRKLAVGLVGLAFLVMPGSASAVLLNYTFTGFAGPGSTLCLDPCNIDDDDPIDLLERAFRITGMTLSDIDSEPDDGTGAYSAMSTYAFDGIGEFVTDAVTGEFYIQDCFSPDQFNCVGLTDPSISAGFLAKHPLQPFDPDLGGVPLGGPFATLLDDAGIRTLVNSFGHILVFIPFDIDDVSLTVTAKSQAPIPEPSTILLLASGLAGLGFFRRRRKREV